MSKPFSQACENNKEPILSVLKNSFSNTVNVLEIGSGTGQHAVHMARHLPHLSWTTSDRLENHEGIRSWIQDADLPNAKGPIELDVTQQDWPVIAIDGVFSANTAHIMSWAMVEKMVEGLGKILQPEGVFCLYGPFNYKGKYTSESNARFDHWLKQQNAAQGIRDFEELVALAKKSGLEFQSDHPMPANNRILVWQKKPGP